MFLQMRVESRCPLCSMTWRFIAVCYSLGEKEFWICSCLAIYSQLILCSYFINIQRTGDLIFLVFNSWIYFRIIGYHIQKLLFWILQMPYNIYATVSTCFRLLRIWTFLIPMVSFSLSTFIITYKLLLNDAVCSTMLSY